MVSPLIQIFKLKEFFPGKCFARYAYFPQVYLQMFIQMLRAKSVKCFFLLCRSCCLFFTRCHIKKHANYRKNTISPLKIISKYPHYTHWTRALPASSHIARHIDWWDCFLNEKVVKFQFNAALRKSDVIFTRKLKIKFNSEKFFTAWNLKLQPDNSYSLKQAVLARYGIFIVLNILWQYIAMPCH